MLMEGPLSKWTNVMQGWQYRWFVLDEYNGVLSYYTSKEKMLKGVRRGCVRLKGAILGIDNEDESTFTVKVDHKTFHFQARDSDEREQWTRALEVVIRLQFGPDKYFTQRYRPNLPEFEKRLAESDAYLQLLMDQSKQLRAKRDQFSGVARGKLDAIVNATDQMAEEVKRAVVILQIAKSECLNPALPYPEASLRTALQAAPSNASFSLDAFSTNSLKSTELLPESTATRTLQILPRSKASVSESEGDRLAPLLPWTSYSSDDEYYDAEDTFDDNKKVTVK